MHPDIIRARALRQLPDNFQRLSGSAKVNAILDLSDPESFIRKLAPDSLYLLLREIGVEDCLDLIPMTTSEQRQAFVDLDVWRGAELDTAELDAWLAILSAAGGEQLVVDTVSDLDPELLVDYILNHAVIVLDRTEEDEIEAYEQHYIHLRTPDQDFVIVLPPTEEDEASRVTRMVDALYRGGLKRARDLMFACKTGLRLENEELAYRFRTGRLADLGFPSREDAWNLFSPIDEEALRQSFISEPRPPMRVGEDQEQLGLIMSRSLREKSFLNRCLEGVRDTERFVREYGAMVNRSVVAEPGEFVLRDVDRLASIAATARATISLGLEILAEGSETKGKDIIDRVWLIQLHQLGHRAAVKRAVEAKRLQLLGGTLFPPAIQAVLEHLRWIPRPYYTEPSGNPRPFRSMNDLTDTDRILDYASRLADGFEKSFGISSAKFSAHEFPGLSEDDRAYITYETLAQTLIARFLITGSPSLQPLSPSEVLEVAARAKEVEGAAAELASQIQQSADVLTQAATQLVAALQPIKVPSDVNLLRTALLITSSH